MLGPALPPPLFGSPETGGDSNSDPLRPADTSSPRDTLQSFLTDMGTAIEDRRRGTMSPEGRAAFNRAMGTLDFSTAPEGNSWLVRIQRMALLYEVLSRIELPPADQIPGDAEIADAGGAVVRWTFPNARITLERIEQGPRAGEFRFSADTVGRIDRLYRQSAHLPYKPGVTESIYELVVGDSYAQYERARQLRNRLKPVDTSSPRATLEGFLDSMNRAYALVMEAEAALEADPPTMTREDAREAERMASYLLRRATVALDLSQVPSALREDTGEEAALLLKEVLDRVLLPPIDSVPSAQMVASARAGALGAFVRGTGPLRWRIPNTEIEIVETTEGAHPGQFLFGAATVERIRDDYRDVRLMDYRESEFVGIDLL
jgi:MscS family membrane protein